jgi:hypothetical protein
LWCRSGNESDSMAMADHRWPAVKKVQRFRWGVVLVQPRPPGLVLRATATATAPS